MELSHCVARNILILYMVREHLLDLRPSISQAIFCFSMFWVDDKVA